MKCLLHDVPVSRKRVDVIFGSCYGKEHSHHPQKAGIYVTPPEGAIKMFLLPSAFYLKEIRLS